MVHSVRQMVVKEAPVASGEKAEVFALMQISAWAPEGRVRFVIGSLRMLGYCIVNVTDA